LLTEQAQKELDRLRSGKTEKQWKADKAKQKVADKKAASDARKAAAKAQREQRAADERKAREQARKAGAKARGERLRQLKDERAKKGEPEPTTKRKRQQTENTLKREAGKAGKAAERKSFEDFKAQRKQQEDAAKAKARTDAQARQKARQQQRDVQRQAQAQHEAQEAQAKQKREEAIQKAKKAGSLETPEPILKMNADARRRNQAQNRDQELGKAAHVVNQAAAAVRALDAYEDARGKGKGMFGAGVDAFKTYLDNTNPVMGAIANAEAKQRKDEKGEQYYGTDAVDAWLGTVGETGAGYIVPGAGWDQAINAGANLIGAVDDHVHKGRDPASPEAKKASVKDVTSLTADLTPSRMFSQTMGAGLRAYWDLEKAKQGDFKGIDKFGEDAVKGKLGPIFQPWAMGADFLGNLGGNSAGAAFDKTLKKSEDTTLAKVGTSGGDLAYALGQSKDAKAGKYGPTLQTYSTVLGMGNDMIAGKTFNQAIDKAASEGSTDAQGVKAVRDAAVAAEQKAKEVWNEDLPAAKKRVGEAIDKVEQVIDDPGKALSTAKNKLGRLWAKL
jgi:chemotaxis protein histidine kinase CheA